MPNIITKHRKFKGIIIINLRFLIFFLILNLSLSFNYYGFVFKLQSSEVRSPSPSSLGPSLYRCKICQNLYMTRRELYVHRNIEHGQTGHRNSVIPPNITDQKLQNVFKANSKFIFEDNAEDDVQSTINIPLQNDVSIQEIVNQAEQIFNNSKQHLKYSFLLALSFGTSKPENLDI